MHVETVEGKGTKFVIDLPVQAVKDFAGLSNYTISAPGRCRKNRACYESERSKHNGEK